MKHVEDRIHRAIANLLYSAEFYQKDFFFWHCPNGIQASKKQGAKFKAMGMRAGIPDIIILTRRKICFIELKTEKGYLSKNQKRVKAIIERLGWPYYTIKTDCKYEACREVERILNEVRA